jgi:hypothetical protein
MELLALTLDDVGAAGLHAIGTSLRSLQIGRLRMVQPPAAAAIM